MKSHFSLPILLVISACQPHTASRPASNSESLATGATTTQLSGWATQQQTADPASFISVSQSERAVLSVTKDGSVRHIDIHGDDSPKGVTVTTTHTGQLIEITIQSGGSAYKLHNSGGKLILFGPET